MIVIKLKHYDNIEHGPKPTFRVDRVDHFQAHDEYGYYDHRVSTGKVDDYIDLERIWS